MNQEMTPKSFIKTVEFDSATVGRDKDSLESFVATINYFLKKNKNLSESKEVEKYLSALSKRIGIEVSISKTKSSVEKISEEKTKEQQEDEKKNANTFAKLLVLKDFGTDEIRFIEGFAKNYKNSRINFTLVSDVEKYIIYSVVSRYIEDADTLKEIEKDFMESMGKEARIDDSPDALKTKIIKSFIKEIVEKQEMVFHLDIDSESFGILDVIEEDTIKELFVLTKSKNNFQKEDIYAIIDG